MLENISLKPYNSFGCDTIARYFTTIQKEVDLMEALDWSKLKAIPLLILGGGSNMLFTQKVEGLVLKMENKGIQKTNETSTEVFLTVGAGENWHHFVSYCVQKGWGGIENLSLIPGTVGACPIQNIGAYGAEVKDVIEYVTAYDTRLEKWVTLNNKSCEFEYRNSLFKKEKNRFVIWQVQFKLNKQPTLRTDYGAIREVLHHAEIKNPSLADVSNAVIQIRNQKLPDPKIIGNAGSFFKNPTVSKELFEALKVKFPTIMAFPISDHEYKLAAGWLIEYCGWKGKKIGNVGCHAQQALVIVNYGNATGEEIYGFSESIIQSVLATFGVTLEIEVNII